MTGQQWSELQELLASALERPPEERTGFLDRVCAGREALRRELAELIAAHGRGSPLDRPVAALLDPSLVEPVRPGKETVAHYRVLERLGRGGMGVVYRARDLRLGRTVALKFLPAHLSFNDAAKGRLRAEAYAAATLDHLNICTIHEIGEAADGRLFIAMPYYDGETLDVRLDRGPLPRDEAIALLIQAARGLAQAHERGVVHRDIKPANLMVTRDGVLKILDFGIAKLADVQLTPSGERPGTVAYMSPEQIMGERLDGRTDVWSLGVVFHQMITGERRFRGANRLAVMQAILDYRPEPLRVADPAFPEALDRLLGRMLARHAPDRAVAAELVGELEQLLPPRTAAAEPPEVLPEGERRQVTILSTVLGERRHPAEAQAPEPPDRPTERLRSAADEVVRRHGGVVNRFDGATLEALFGVPATHEDDPVRAVRASLELHRRVGQLTGRLAGPESVGPSIRSGIHTALAGVRPDGGDQGAYRVTGSVLQVAGELSQQAPPGEIWVTSECRRAVAGRFDTEALPPAARDDGSCLIPYRVLGASGDRTRLEAAQRAGLTRLVGRETEMAALERALAEAVSGTGRFITVVGEAGVGKSRLLLELRRRLGTAQVGLLQGRCEPTESGTSYLPFVELLRDWLEAGHGQATALDPGSAGAGLRALGEELEEFIPLYLHLLALPSPEHQVPRHLHGEQYRLAMQEALTAFVTLAARRQPAALLLEDWHWADEASHGVLQEVAELVTGFPLLVVVSCRPTPARTWGDPGHHQLLSLEPLDPEASGSMLRSILRVESVPPRLIGVIHERTGGNPFFLEEITQTLLEEGALGVENGEAVLTGALDPLQLPTTVQAVLRARLDRLDRGTREVLRLAAVVGREFSRGILEHARDSGGLPHALQTLKASGVIQQIRVVPEPVYRFRHALLQEAALGSLLEDQRRELHRRVGEAVEALHAHAIDEQLGRLVEHFSRAEEWARAVDYACRLAQRATALCQFAEALEILERAQSWLLRLPDPPARRDTLADILFRQERLCETLGLRGRQERIIEELVGLLEPSGTPAMLAEAYLRMGDLNTLLRRFAQAESALQRALDLRRGLGDAIGERNTLRSLGLLRWHQGRDDEALDCIEAALATDRERDDLEAQVGDLANFGNVLKGMGRLERARGILEEALRLSARLEVGAGDVSVTDLSYKRTYILHNLANVHRELGDDATALEYLTQARRLTKEKRLPIQLSYHFTSTAHIYLRHGRVEESLNLYREAVELTRKARFAPGLSQALRFLGELLLGVGRDEEALGPLVEAAGLFAQLREPETEARLWSEIATLHERRGDLRDALAAWGKAHAVHRADPHQPRQLEVLEGLARVARRCLPEPSIAVGYYGEALALAQRLGDRPSAGRLRNAIGIIEWERGRYDEARAQYQAGLDIFRELGDSVNAALMLASLGVTLGAMGRRVEARRCLEEACRLHRAAADRLGEARALGALADVLGQLGEGERARECWEASLHLRQECGDRTGEGWMLQRLALAHFTDGATDRARERAVEAARIAAEIGDGELAAACQGLPGALGR